MLGFAVALTGCGQENAEPLPIERLAFVAPGSVNVAGQRLGMDEPLLVDRFEVTRGQWYDFARSEDDGVEPPDPEAQSLPQVDIDLNQARAFAAWNGMRLPTVGEWLWFASGPRAMTYPFGTNPAQSAANTLELGLWRATPVGTFPGGRTPGTAIYDLLGNVAEWALAEGWQGRGWYPRLALELTFQGLESWAMGGSFLTHARPIYLFEPNYNYVALHAVERDPAFRASDLGMRCVADARQWLVAHAEDLSRRENRDRLIAVGQSWGPRAAALLATLAEEHPKYPALAWLLEGARKP
ncbi:MAG: SUMF1/EgtB/PvdO family nonheme iron enzyme [Planctomycetota bacterium]